MKTIFFASCIISVVFVNLCQAQDSITKSSKYDFYIETGVLLTPLGPCLGLAFDNPDKSISFLARNDFWFQVGKMSYVDTNGYWISEKNYSLLRYSSMTYFDIEYKLKKALKIPLIFAAGYGWIYLGNRENHKFNRDYGYSVASLKLKYIYSWLSFELRGNIPIRDAYFKKYNNAERSFPLQFFLLYRFKPKKAD